MRESWTSSKTNERWNVKGTALMAILLLLSLMGRFRLIPFLTNKGLRRALIVLCQIKSLGTAIVEYPYLVLCKIHPLHSDQTAIKQRQKIRVQNSYISEVLILKKIVLEGSHRLTARRHLKAVLCGHLEGHLDWSQRQRESGKQSICHPRQWRYRGGVISQVTSAANDLPWSLS